MIRHRFTVDVEEHFQVHALAPHVARERWDALESRVAANVDRLLELLARYDAKGTFFTLGWVAERQPAMVKAIAGEFGDDVWIGCAYLGARPIACGCGFRWGGEFEMTWASAPAATPSPDDSRYAWGPRLWKRLPVPYATALGPWIVRGSP